MFCLMFCFYYLLAFIGGSYEEDQRIGTRTISESGDIILGGIIPLHFFKAEGHVSLRKPPSKLRCASIVPRTFRWLMIMIYAVLEINQNRNILPNTTIGYIIYDSCFTIPKVLENSLRVLDEYSPSSVKQQQKFKVDVILGPYASEVAKFLSIFLELFQLPQVSYGVSCKCLSDKKVFPFFIRTMSSNLHHSTAMARLVELYGWEYVGTLTFDDEYGRSAMSDFISEVELTGVCIAYREILQQHFQSEDLQKLAETFVKSNAKIIVSYLHDKDFFELSETFLEHNLTDITWMPMWIGSPLLRTLRYAEMYDGSIAFALRNGYISGLKEFLTSLGRQLFQKNTEQIPRQETMIGSQRLSSSNNTLNYTEWTENQNQIFFSPFEKGFLKCLQHLCRRNKSSKRSMSPTLTPVITLNNDKLAIISNNMSIHLPHNCCSNPIYITQSAINESKYFTINNIHRYRKTYGCSSENYTCLKRYTMEQLKLSKLLHGNYLKGKAKNVLSNENSYFMTIRQSQKSSTGTVLLNNKDTLKPIFMEFWQDLFNCTWNPISKSVRACTGVERLEDAETPFTDVSQLRYSYATYMSVYVVAHAFRDIQTCIPGKGPFRNSSCTSMSTVKPWQLLLHLRRVRFINNIGEMHSFDENGDPPGLYDLLSWTFDRGSVMDFKIVGSYNSSAPPGERIHVDEKNIRWNGGTTQVPRSVCSDPCAPGTRKMGRQGESICCFDCIPCIAGEFSNVTDSQGCYRCPRGFWSNELQDSCFQMPEEFLAFSDALAIVLLILAMIGGLVVVGVTLLMITHRYVSIVSGMNHTINVIQLLILAASLASCAAFVGRPTHYSCQLRAPLVISCVSLSIACTLYNIIQLSVVNKAKFSIVCADKLLRHPPVVLGFCGCLQAVFCILMIYFGNPKPVDNAEARVGIVIVECIWTSAIWAILSLVYVAILVIACLCLAYKSFQFPSEFQEPKLITYNMMFCFIVFLAFVPAYSSTQGKFATAIEICAVIAISYSFLGCAFFPKCYVILCKMHKV